MKEVKVKNTTLDNFFQDKPRIDFIKIDIEGAEMPVLKGGQKIIERDRPVLCIEYHGGKCGDFGYTVSDLEAFVKKLDYSEKRISQGSNGYFQTIAVHSDNL